MPETEKSIDIRLYSLSKVQAAFDEAVAADEQPAADVIAAMRDRIQEYLTAGKSISWVISVLQRGGLDLGARQLRTYLQRAGIGRDAKRTARTGNIVTKRSTGRECAQAQGRATKPTGASGEAMPEAGPKPIPAQVAGTAAGCMQSTPQPAGTARETQPADPRHGGSVASATPAGCVQNKPQVDGERRDVRQEAETGNSRTKGEFRQKADGNQSAKHCNEVLCPGATIAPLGAGYRLRSEMTRAKAQQG